MQQYQSLCFCVKGKLVQKTTLSIFFGAHLKLACVAGGNLPAVVNLCNAG